MLDAELVYSLLPWPAGYVSIHLAEATFSAIKRLCHGYGLVFETSCTLCLGTTPHPLDEENLEAQDKECATPTVSHGHADTAR